MCIIKALLIVAAHSGQIDPDVEQALGAWFKTPTRIVRWRFGGRPILHRTHVALDPSKQEKDLDLPLAISQLNKNVGRLAEQYGIIGRVTTHDIRRSAAAEISRVPREQTQNVAAAASLMGHTVQSILAGVINEYIGDPDIDFWE